MPSAWHRHYLIRRYLQAPVLRLLSVVLTALRPVVPASLTRLDRPIFIVGVSRSGTTAFAEEFARHRDLCSWSEAVLVFEPHFYDADRDTFKDAAEATPAAAWRIRLLCGLRARAARRPRFANKHPENSLRLAFLDAVFPDALFVHVLRDGRAVAESNYRVTLSEPVRAAWPFGQFPKPVRWRSYLDLPLLEQFAHQWVDIVEHIATSAAELGLGPERFLEIHYEELCADPAEVLGTVDAFCGLDTRRRPAVESFDNRNDDWSSRLDADQIDVMESIVGALNARLGYE